MAFAETTKVPVDKTRLEIERMLHKRGASHFGTFSEPDGAMIVFRLKDRNMRFRVPLDTKLTQQDLRARWRALLLVIKAKLESVDAKIETMEEAFLAHVIMETGRTVYEELKEPLQLRYNGDFNIPLLPPPGK